MSVPVQTRVQSMSEMENLKSVRLKVGYANFELIFAFILNQMKGQTISAYVVGLSFTKFQAEFRY